MHDVVVSIKANLRVDWTEPRDDVRAVVRMAVKRVLLKRGIRPDDFDTILPFVMKQAEASFRNWPLAA